MFLLPVLLVMSIFMVMDIDSFNRMFDYLVPVYLVGSVLSILLYIRRHRDRDRDDKESSNSEEYKPYVLKKKSKVNAIPPGDWKAKFFGKWDKVTRVAFGDFMIFNGAPSMAAYLAKDAYFGQELLDADGDGVKLQLNAFGMPSGDGMPYIVGTSEENAIPGPGKDPQKRPFQGRHWWDENEKALKTKLIYDGDTKLIMEQTRKIDENDIMTFVHSATKGDGSTASYTATLKRMNK